MTLHFKDQELGPTQKSTIDLQIVIKCCQYLLSGFLNYFKGCTMMVGNCCQDFNHWKLAELCKLLHNQWRCFTAVGKIKIDIGLNLLISAKYKMHVHWLPC